MTACDRPRRRVLQALTVGAALCVAHTARGAERPRRLGILRPTGVVDNEFLYSEGLKKLGYVEGVDVLVERRYADAHAERLPALAAELVRWKADAILAVGSAAVRAAMTATSTIPIVMFTTGDPVALGFVRSLARPGGNVTGITFAPNGTLAGKKLQLLVEMVPGIRRVAFLWPEDPDVGRQVAEVTDAARTIGLTIVPIAVRGADYAAAFDEIAKAGVRGIFVASSTFFARDREQIIGHVAKSRLPAIYEWREDVQQGGLMTYATSLREMIARVANYVDRIFKGAVPAEMPVEQPTRLELAINLKTARALGLTVPQALLLRADEVID